MTRLRHTISPFILLSIFGLYSTVAAAQTPEGQCASDSDCPTDSTCAKNQWSSGCAASPGGEMPECEETSGEDEFGVCVQQPKPCESDEECGEYLSCVTSSTGSCSVSSDGERTCEEVSTESYCGEKTTSCATNSDCPREFECVQAETLCLDFECPEDGGECGTCSAEGERECRPKEIACEMDDECPSDWSCWGAVDYECSGGDGATSVGGAPSVGGATSQPDRSGSSDPGAGGKAAEDAAAPAPPPRDTDKDGESESESCVEVPAIGFCYPNAWNGINLGGGGRGDAAAGELQETDDGSGPVAPNVDKDGDVPPADEAGESEEESAFEGGCSVSPTSPNNTGWWLAVLFVLPGLRRRFAHSLVKS